MLQPTLANGRRIGCRLAFRDRMVPPDPLRGAGGVAVVPRSTLKLLTTIQSRRGGREGGGRVPPPPPLWGPGSWLPSRRRIPNGLSHISGPVNRIIPRSLPQQLAMGRRSEAWRPLGTSSHSTAPNPMASARCPQMCGHLCHSESLLQRTRRGSRTAAQPHPHRRDPVIHRPDPREGGCRGGGCRPPPRHSRRRGGRQGSRRGPSAASG